MMEEWVCYECDWTGDSRDDAERHERETCHMTVRREDGNSHETGWHWSIDWGD